MSAYGKKEVARCDFFIISYKIIAVKSQMVTELSHHRQSGYLNTGVTNHIKNGCVPSSRDDTRVI